MRHRTLAVALIGLVALGGAVEETTGGIGGVLAIRRISALLPAVPGLSVGRVSARDGALSIGDLDYGAANGIRIHVGRLTLPGGAGGLPGIVAAAAAAPAGIAATDISVTIRHNVIAIPRVEAQGTYLTADRLKALLDPATGASAAERLAELTAASLTAPTLTITAVPSNPDEDGAKATFEDVALTDVVAGRIGSASFRRATLFKSAVVGAPTLATLGSVALNGLDLPLVTRIVETGRTNPEEPPRAVFGSLSVREVAIGPDDAGALRIGAIAADGFRGRPLLRHPAEIAALIDKPSGSQTPDDIRTLADIAVDAAKGFSLDHLQWDDVTFSAKDKEAVLFKLGRMAIDGLTPAQIRNWTLADLSLSSDQVSLTLRRLVLQGPDESRLVDILAHELASSGLAMDRTRLMSGIPQDGSLSMLGLHIDAPSADQPGNSPDGRRNIIDLPVVSFASETDASTNIAIATAQAQATYALPTASDNPGLAALARNGLKALDARADYRMAFDPNGREIRLDPLTIAAEKLGRISVSTDVGNIPFELLASGNALSDAQAAIDQVTFKGLVLDVVNDGVVELMLPALAASANTSVPMLKIAVKTQSDLFIGQILGATPAASRLEAAVDAFIDDPHNLHIAVTAPAGLTGAEIKAAPDPKSLLDRVGIEAAANR